MKYYFRQEKRNEFLSKYSMKEYASYFEITIGFLCQILNGKRHTTKALAYALSMRAGRSVNYFFEGVE